MKILVVEPYKKPEIRTIDGSLESMQQVVDCGTKGIVRRIQHGNVVFRITHADEDLLAQHFLQLPGTFTLADALGLDIDIEVCTTGHHAVFAKFFIEPAFYFVHQLHFFGGTMEEMGNGGLCDSAVNAELQEGS